MSTGDSKVKVVPSGRSPALLIDASGSTAASLFTVCGWAFGSFASASELTTIWVVTTSEEPSG